MAGGAAGGFVNRAFESMLKECSSKKLVALQIAIQKYLDGTKEINQHAGSSEGNQLSSLAVEQRIRRIG
ncbi:hypothetical protein RHSIM_Rhsim05G0000600 [Rhododendron simsii]|uniref:Uncharacterized protein n=1 Tax=Rhododendron simsii TaxID=118357 RepID=A0A834LMJ6_RHOSS|nr:hypothetical protein RHSIM_Rhsim05G0000600 [Rhododendron simsii]